MLPRATGALLPYAVRPTRVIWMIVHSPPPTPPCFPSQPAWQQYLMYLHESGEQITRRVDRGKPPNRVVTREFDRIDYCSDCDIGSPSQRKAQAEGRCILPASQLREAAACSTP